MAGDTVILLLGLMAVVLVCFKLVRYRQRQSRSRNKSVCIIVLGDIGRSPRMLYHATSFVDRGFKTYIIAYPGSPPPQSLAESPYVKFVYLPSPMAFVSKLPKPLFLLLSPFKVLAGALSLLWAIVYRLDSTPEFTLVQNPPAIPTLPVVKLANLLCPSKIIIDWHNTGYSVLSLRLGTQSPVVRLAKGIESVFGRTAYAHLCVTHAMRQHLIRDVGLCGRVVVLHDRPPSHFRKQTPAEVHELFARLPKFTGDTNMTADLFTTVTGSDGTPALSTQRPALLVSATSWTADEDFSILLDALSQYNRAVDALSAGLVGRGAGTLPAVVVIITGKGAGKTEFEAEVAKLETKWKWVRVRTAWLPLEDYPRLLGSADLGISLHTSTSGADLPMKVVDMFGCDLPVCALDFACIDELVQDQVNGHTFKSASDLLHSLMTLLRDFPHDTSALDELRQGIKRADYAGEEWCSWDENWSRVMHPLLLDQVVDTSRT